MEDIQLLVYIIFLVFYLIFKALQKKKEPPTRNPEKAEQRPERKRKPAMTFEEMLKEFTGETYTPEKKEAESGPKPPRKTATEPYREPARKAEKETEYFTYEKETDSRAKQVYEESVKHGGKAKTLDERIDLENLEVGNVELIVEEDEENAGNTANEYLQMFSSADEAKKAIVISEIFNRKYS
ncbi:hypothetical protein BH23BAC1_BH23BAC1_35590 [soil metagenome]